jgi:hypothetical protein
MKKFLVVFCVAVLTGCAGSTSQYYEAVQKAAEASSAAHQAKFEALSKIAASGDGQAASAAVMALALTQTQTIQPMPQQSEAIQWASVLASPVTSLGMMWMQADSAKTMARYSSKTDLARVAAESKDNQALYGAFVDSAAAGYEALGNVDYTPFIDGMVTLGVTGMDNIVDTATAGFDANTAIATTGMNNLYNLGTNGMNNLVTLGTNGLDAAETLGIQGMLGIHETNEDWLSYLNKSDLIMQDMMKANGCVITTDSNNKVVVTCN